MGIGGTGGEAANQVITASRPLEPIGRFDAFATNRFPTFEAPSTLTGGPGDGRPDGLLFFLLPQDATDIMFTLEDRAGGNDPHGYVVGVVDLNVERCVGDVPADAMCVANACGDGLRLRAEACDDGNVVAGDGCSPACEIEANFECRGELRSTCQAQTCGNGRIEGNEACDDRNLVAGDGCSATCTIEAGWGCTNAINLNTGSDGAGGQAELGSRDPVWSWAQGTLEADGTAPTLLPAGLVYEQTTVIRECVGAWHDAVAPAQWVNTTGWDVASRNCRPHPTPGVASLRYYRATFNIADAQAASVTTLAGRMWADNQAKRIFINGSNVVEYEGQGAFQTGQDTDFGLWGSSYYRAGENEIVIAIWNAPGNDVNPEGLLVSVPNAFAVGSACASLCGNGRVDATEECDDGNANAGDGCAIDCTVEESFLCTGSPSSCADCADPTGLPDGDGDGVRDACDLCPMDANRSTFNWVVWASRDSNTLTGTVGNTPVTFTSNRGFAYDPIPPFYRDRIGSRFNVPSDGRLIPRNRQISDNTLTFARPVSNPLLTFMSIGDRRTNVPVTFDQPVELVWGNEESPDFGAPVLSADGLTLTGRESYAVVRIRGNHSSVNFSYGAVENSVDFLFGFGGDNSDLDGNGIADVCQDVVVEGP